jgi:peptidoglycan hydrolase-like protein with peptidoglycan-binding domain
MNGEPYIPETITVHLGPPNAAADNVTVSFPDYIKNVASSEIYPTWPESAIRANIYAQISYALNRFYTEWYPSRGYDFDITNTTAYDQSYVQGRNIFDNISRIVDEIFNSYVVRGDAIEPYFTQYCNGTTVTCDGLSQWGTVPLAESGLTPLEILRNYYGNEIRIVEDAPVRGADPSYPGQPIRLGEAGNEVKFKQVQLNRISRNYPAIPKINPVDGIFGQETEAAVKEFQRIFNLTPDGIIGPATWYKIIAIYNGVKRLAELDSEGISAEEISKEFPGVLAFGDTGQNVRNLQYFLAVVGEFYDTVPQIEITGVYDEPTRQAVIAFQNVYGLTPDGIVGIDTWQDLYRAYRGILASTNSLEGGVALYPGVVLRQGTQGEAVETIQEYLSYLSRSYPEIPDVPVTGVFGAQTAAAVEAFQSLFGLNVNGVVGPDTWNSIASAYADLKIGHNKQAQQFSGTDYREGMI